MLSKDFINYLKTKEGYRRFTYTCPAGKKTIGYGHVLKEGEDYYRLDEHYAERVMLEDVAEIEYALCIFMPDIKKALKQHEYESLLSLLYNWGTSRFIRSKLAQAIKCGDSDEAANQFLNICHVNGKKCNGLFIRRYEEMIIFKYGWDALNVLKQIKKDCKNNTLPYLLT